MLASQITDTELEERFASLTKREVGILRDAAAGYSNREIGQRNAIKEGTVKEHLYNVYKMLRSGQKIRFNRTVAISLLQRYDALQYRKGWKDYNRKGWKDYIWIQDSVVNRCPEQNITRQDLVDLVLACFDKNVEELTFRFRSLNLKALKMKDKGGTDYLLIVDRD